VSTNVYEMQGRARKVGLIVDVLVERLIGLLDKDNELWEAAAKEAGTPIPSDTSKALIRERLRGRK
jgi:hypothetical protein